MKILSLAFVLCTFFNFAAFGSDKYLNVLAGDSKGTFVGGLAMDFQTSNIAHSIDIHAIAPQTSASARSKIYSITTGIKLFYGESNYKFYFSPNIGFILINKEYLNSLAGTQVISIPFGTLFKLGVITSISKSWQIGVEQMFMNTLFTRDYAQSIQSSNLILRYQF